MKESLLSLLQPLSSVCENQEGKEREREKKRERTEREKEKEIGDGKI